MNLFLVGIGLSELMKASAAQAMRSATNVYPQLDVDTLGIWSERNAFIGTLCTNPVIASPREYVAKAEGAFTFFSGVPISSDKNIVPHNAADLARHWNQLPNKLDGQFSAVKVDLQNLRIDVLTDPLGMEQVYVHHRGPTVIVSNSVRLIEQTCGLRTIDEVGACLFLSLGWVGGDRTLRESIQVLQGGYLHQWESDGSYTAFAYFPRTKLARLNQRWDDLRIKELAHRFTSNFCDLADRLGPLECDLTGGHDSRVNVAAVIASGIPATFVTEGSPKGADVQIGRTIAEALHLQHRLEHLYDVVVDRWDEGVCRLIAQTDGMVNLWQVTNSIAQPTHINNLPLSVWGVGGEIGSGSYYRKMKLPPTLGDSRILRLFFSSLLKKHTELLKEETRQLALNSVRETCQGFLDDGFEPFHVPDAFYIFDRVRRWAGINTRKATPICDLFTPFCTIPYIESALAMPLSERVAGKLHHELIRATTPVLLDFPYDKPKHRPIPKLNAKRMIAQTVREATPSWLLRILRYGNSQLRRNKSREGKRIPQPEWVEAKREAILNVCLDQKSSVLWDYVDRRSFEDIMSPKTTKEIRYQHCTTILSIATLFYYEAEH